MKFGGPNSNERSRAGDGVNGTSLKKTFEDLRIAATGFLRRDAENDVRPWADIEFPAGRKSGWAMLQPAASLRPVMTKRLCTSPSLVPFGFRLKRASRMGPFCVMNHGTPFFAPLRVAIPINGFCAGLD